MGAADRRWWEALLIGASLALTALYASAGQGEHSFRFLRLWLCGE